MLTLCHVTTIVGALENRKSEKLERRASNKSIIVTSDLLQMSCGIDTWKNMLGKLEFVPATGFVRFNIYQPEDCRSCKWPAILISILTMSNPKVLRFLGYQIYTILEKPGSGGAAVTLAADHEPLLLKTSTSWPICGGHGGAWCADTVMFAKNRWITLGWSMGGLWTINA